jgi:hypothetical protein
MEIGDELPLESQGKLLALAVRFVKDAAHIIRNEANIDRGNMTIDLAPVEKGILIRTGDDTEGTLISGKAGRLGKHFLLEYPKNCPLSRGWGYAFLGADVGENRLHGLKSELKRNADDHCPGLDLGIKCVEGRRRADARFRLVWNPAVKVTGPSFKAAQFHSEAIQAYQARKTGRALRKAVQAIEECPLFSFSYAFLRECLQEARAYKHFVTRKLVTPVEAGLTAYEKWLLELRDGFRGKPIPEADRECVEKECIREVDARLEDIAALSAMIHGSNASTGVRSNNPANICLKHLRLGDKSTFEDMLSPGDYTTFQKMLDEAAETLMSDDRFATSKSAREAVHRGAVNDLYAALTDLSADRTFTFPESTVSGWRQITLRQWVDAVFGLTRVNNSQTVDVDELRDVLPDSYDPAGRVERISHKKSNDPGKKDEGK